MLGNPKLLFMPEFAGFFCSFETSTVLTSHHVALHAANDWDSENKQQTENASEKHSTSHF